MKPTEYKTGSIAKALNVHENTIRDWSDRYQSLLSKRATSGRRKFTEDDFLLLATIADYRDKGLSLDAIEAALQKGQRIDKAPDVPTPDELEARQDVEIVAIPRDSYLLEVERYQLQIEVAKAEIERLKSDLVGAVGDKERIQSRLMEVTSLYDAAKARLEIIEQERRPAAYWLAIIAGIVITVILIAAVVVVYFGSRG